LVEIVGGANPANAWWFGGSMPADLAHRDSDMPRFSELDFDPGPITPPMRMDTLAMLKSELHSRIDDNSLVRAVQRTVAAGPAELFMAILKPLVVFGILIGGLIGVSLAMNGGSPAKLSPMAMSVFPSKAEPAPEREPDPRGGKPEVTMLAAASTPQAAEPFSEETSKVASAVGSSPHAGFRRGRYMKMRMKIKMKRRWARKRGKMRRRRR
jgi:hypothetical protein